MKIYAAENDNYIGYVLVGDHDKEYSVGGFRKDDSREFKKEVNKSLHVRKFIKDTNLYYTCPALESYSERDKYFLMCADLQAKFQRQRDNLNTMSMNKGNSR